MPLVLVILVADDIDIGWSFHNIETLTKLWMKKIVDPSYPNMFCPLAQFIINLMQIGDHDEAILTGGLPELNEMFAFFSQFIKFQFIVSINISTSQEEVREEG